MLHLAERFDGEPRLYLRHPTLRAEAWIERAHSPTPYPFTDWALWYRRAPHEWHSSATSDVRRIIFLN